MSVNIGHGDRRVIDAITAQAHEAPVRPAGLRDRDPGPPRGQARRDPARRHGQGLLHARRRRGDRERHQARPPRDRPLQGPRPLSLVPRRDARRDDPDRRPAPLGQRARPRRASSATRTRTAGARRSPVPWRRASRASRTSSATRAPHTIAAVFLETIVGTNGILIPPDGYIAGRPRDLRPPRHPDGRRRGHGRLRPDRPLVRGRPLGRHPGPHDDGQGPDARATCRSARWRCATSIAEQFDDQDVLRRPDLQQPPGQPGGRRSRRSRSTRRTTSSSNAARLGPVMRDHHERLAAEAPERRARPATSACSGSSTSSGRAIRGRR